MLAPPGTQEADLCQLKGPIITARSGTFWFFRARSSGVELTATRPIRKQGRRGLSRCAFPFRQPGKGTSVLLIWCRLSSQPGRVTSYRGLFAPEPGAKAWQLTAGR
jgi:hypothetical protein